jgi:broad specificity polyphosphatase/5'/3'-nucleotidase SurE
MHILVTNDDGVQARGLLALLLELLATSQSWPPSEIGLPLGM